MPQAGPSLSTPDNRQAISRRTLFGGFALVAAAASMPRPTAAQAWIDEFEAEGGSFCFHEGNYWSRSPIPSSDRMQSLLDAGHAQPLRGAINEELKRRNGVPAFDPDRPAWAYHRPLRRT